MYFWVYHREVLFFPLEYIFVCFRITIFLRDIQILIHRYIDENTLHLLRRGLITTHWHLGLRPIGPPSNARDYLLYP